MDYLPTQSETARAGSQEAFGLDELLSAAGARLGEDITPRTVRLYATQGLIDRPGKEGRSAVYGRRHLLQLLLIRSLARRGLSLSAIAPLCVLSDGELEQQLGEIGSPSSERSTQDPSSNSALEYLQTLQTGSSSTRSPSQPRPDETLEDDLSSEEGRINASLSLLPLLGEPLSPQSPSHSPSRSGSSRDAASRWHRFSLAPGIELHISDSVSIPPEGSRRLSWLQRLTERLLEQLDQHQS